MVDFMNKAPKKIWVEVAETGKLLAGYVAFRSRNKYIRADLVEELASLLKEWLENADDDKDWIDYEDRVTAALKALEEE
jgi:acetylornithine deacetylase/succinyl-diaminopimelate desuccinylase-like protein